MLLSVSAPPSKDKGIAQATLLQDGNCPVTCGGNASQKGAATKSIHRSCACTLRRLSKPVDGCPESATDDSVHCDLWWERPLKMVPRRSPSTGQALYLLLTDSARESLRKEIIGMVTALWARPSSGTPPSPGTAARACQRTGNWRGPRPPGTAWSSRPPAAGRHPARKS